MPRNTCQPSTTVASAARSSLSQPIPIVSSMPSCSSRLLHQCSDQQRAWNHVERFDSCPPSKFLERFSLACLSFITVVVSHAVTVPPFPILCSRQGFGESISLFVWVGSLTTTNFFFLCFAESLSCRLSMCLDRTPCRWMTPRAAVESIRNRSLIGTPKSSRRLCKCHASAVVVTAASFSLSPLDSPVVTVAEDLRHVNMFGFFHQSLIFCGRVCGLTNPKRSGCQTTLTAR